MFLRDQPDRLTTPELFEMLMYRKCKSNNGPSYPLNAGGTDSLMSDFHLMLIHTSSSKKFYVCKFYFGVHVSIAGHTC